MANTLYQFPADVFYKQLGALEENYLEFLDISNSFMGWLLTLNEEEFKEVYNRITFAPGEVVDGQEIKALAIPFVELAHKGVWEILSSEITKRQVELRTYARIVYLIKQGLLDYEVGDTDSTWRVEVTEEGSKLMDALNIVNSLIMTKQNEQTQSN